METILIVIFIIGYLAITAEHPLKTDKLVPALLMMGILWAIISLNIGEIHTLFDATLHRLTDVSGLPLEEKWHLIEESQLHHLGKTAEIIFFLLGAMTIVEIIDYFKGFDAIQIRATNKKKLLWAFASLAFVLSAIIDNLTATIVLITLLQKIVIDRTLRLWFAGTIIIAANAGGAWSPIGDVTTTMLWIADKVTSFELVKNLFLPSLVCVVIPTFFISLRKEFKGEIETKVHNGTHPYALKMLIFGLSGILFVPIFKGITHQPPYMGMLISLSVITILAEYFSNRMFSYSALENQDKKVHPIKHAISKTEIPSLLFFVGILMSVAALETIGILFEKAELLKAAIPNTDVVVLLLGGLSAVVDNVPLVAASMGMFNYEIDHRIWHFIAYSAGTGGSMLIIGSAAGVVAMGMEKIDFWWYAKNIGPFALAGFMGGALLFMAIS